jgi:hypothetical protein
MLVVYFRRVVLIQKLYITENLIILKNGSNKVIVLGLRLGGLM